MVVTVQSDRQNGALILNFSWLIVLKFQFLLYKLLYTEIWHTSSYISSLFGEGWSTQVAGKQVLSSHQKTNEISSSS